MSKRGYRVVAWILVFVLHISCFATIVSAKTYENISDLGLSSKSAILMDADTGAILYEKNEHEILPPASITKIMTLLLIYEAIADGKIKWEDMVTVSQHAASMGGSQVFLEPMEQQSVHDMTKCIAIASANDAAVAMAEHIGGSEEGFVELMNKRAKELGMADTTFVNACGLDVDGHVTSAHDIALMSCELMKNHPQVTEFTTKWMDSITHKTKKGETEFGLTNTNKLIKWYDGANGLKTGSTGKALYCLSGTAEKNGLKLVGVVMAAPDFKVRFHEVIKLFDYGYANYAVEKGLQAGETVGEIQVYKGMEDTVPVKIKEQVSLLSQKGTDGKRESKLNLTPSIQAPFEKGAKVGELIYLENGEEVGKTDVITAEAMERTNVEAMLHQLLRKWCGKQKTSNENSK